MIVVTAELVNTWQQENPSTPPPVIISFNASGLLPPHPCSWRGSLTRCRRLGTVWCRYPGGQNRAGIVRHRPHRSGYYIRFGRKSHLLEGTVLDSVPLGQDKRRQERGERNMLWNPDSHVDANTKRPGCWWGTLTPGLSGRRLTFPGWKDEKVWKRKITGCQSSSPQSTPREAQKAQAVHGTDNYWSLCSHELRGGNHRLIPQGMRGVLKILAEGSWYSDTNLILVHTGHEFSHISYPMKCVYSPVKVFI